LLEANCLNLLVVEVVDLDSCLAGAVVIHSVPQAYSKGQSSVVPPSSTLLTALASTLV
jgi:hypothetical protein